MKKVLITGGCGFIGSHVVEHFLKNTDWHITVVDRLSYAANGYNRLRDIKAFNFNRVKIVPVDFSRPFSVGMKEEIGSVNYILHLGAETHVDNSISDPWPFIQSNIIGTFHILQYARELKGLESMLYASTDEVFGPVQSWEKGFKEWDRYNSTNPYSATKAGATELCMAWANTYGVPVFISYCMNAFGERQHYEKFIPKVIRSVLLGEKVTIHADKSKLLSGSRSYIHCRNIASAFLFLLEGKAKIRDKYNIVGEKEVSNLSLAKTIAEILERELEYEMVDFHSSRPGHDLRYALDGEKMRNMGFSIPIPFEDSLERTIRWMIEPENLRWLNLTEGDLTNEKDHSKSFVRACNGGM